jgi:hypothetical protein
MIAHAGFLYNTDYSPYAANTTYAGTTYVRNNYYDSYPEYSIVELKKHDHFLALSLSPYELFLCAVALYELMCLSAIHSIKLYKTILTAWILKIIRQPKPKSNLKAKLYK